MIRRRSRRMTVAQLKERMDARFTAVDHRFEVDQRFDAVDKRFDQLTVRMDAGFSSMHDKLNAILQVLTTRDDHPQKILNEHETGSEISKLGAGLRKAPPRSDRARAAFARRLERREQYRILAPPDVRHRRREARRWLDEKAVRITNPRFCERRPGERLFESMEERQAVADDLYEALRQDDPELLRAVERLLFEDMTRDFGVTLEEWKRRSVCRSERVSRVRAEMRRAGLM